MKTLIWAISQYRFASRHDRLVRKLTEHYDFRGDGIALFARNFVDDPEHEYILISNFKDGSLWYYIKNRKRLYKEQNGWW